MVVGKSEAPQNLQLNSFGVEDTVPSGVVRIDIYRKIYYVYCTGF